MRFEPLVLSESISPDKHNRSSLKVSQYSINCVSSLAISLKFVCNFNNMAGFSFGHKTLWQYSHSASILFAALLFTAGFLCTLLWTNSLVQTETSAGGSMTATFNQFSPAVSTFSTTYGVVCTLRRLGLLAKLIFCDRQSSVQFGTLSSSLPCSSWSVTSYRYRQPGSVMRSKRQHALWLLSAMPSIPLPASP